MPSEVRLSQATLKVWGFWGVMRLLTAQLLSEARQWQGVKKPASRGTPKEHTCMTDQHSPNERLAPQ